MGLRFRKSMKILPGVRVNLGAKSASVSFGPKGLKHTVSTTGRNTTTVGIPGSGLSFSSSAKSGSGSSEAPSERYTTAERPTSQKNRTVALVLCILLGYLGAHRFYVGKIGTGVLWFCTGGVFGIGWIVDMVTVVVGGLYDSNGYVVREWKKDKAAAAQVTAGDVE